ncbi:MAG: acyl-CoA dehydrogenase family protein [Rhodobacteraceae bacterium]|nr:acyl-CoA dehydrogenase family protein [Paracoccaceae bacterium]
MDIEFSPALEAFRAEVCAFLETAPPDVREAGRKTTSVFAPFETVMAWQKILSEKGWAAPNWPVEYGGTGWSAEQKYIFNEEYARRRLPPLLPNGLKMVGPLLIELGSEEQKQKHLPGILNGDDYWTQGYSEPNAGSDLASLNCSAVRDGDHYIINGQKTWTTLAFKANRMFMLVRTSSEGKKQQGITFLLLDRVDYPGMEIRPIIGLDGKPEQCEVFFNDVRVPVSGRVGAENDGWSVAKSLLKHERGGLGDSAAMYARLELIRAAAQGTPSPFGGMMADDPTFHQAIGELEAEIASCAAYERMMVSGHPIAQDPAAPSITKVIGSELAQKVSTMMAKVSGVNALPVQSQALEVGSNTAMLTDDFDLIAMPYYLLSRATTIYAGSDEVQRDLIARSVLAQHR